MCVIIPILIKQNKIIYIEIRNTMNKIKNFYIEII